MLPRVEDLAAYAPVGLYPGPRAPYVVASSLLADLAVHGRALVAQQLKLSACNNNRGSMLLHARP